MPRHVPRPDASIRMAEPDHGRHGLSSYRATDGSSAHALRGSLSWRPLFRHASRRLGYPMDALFLDFWPPRGLRSGDSCLRVFVRNRSGIFQETDLRIPGYGWRNNLHRIRQHERLGAPHVHHRNELLRQQLFRNNLDGGGGSYGNQNLQLARNDVGWTHHIQDAHAVLHRVPVPIPDWRAYRHYAGNRAFQLAA